MNDTNSCQRIREEIFVDTKTLLENFQLQNSDQVSHLTNMLGLAIKLPDNALHTALIFLLTHKFSIKEGSDCILVVRDFFKSCAAQKNATAYLMLGLMSDSPPNRQEDMSDKKSKEVVSLYKEAAFLGSLMSQICLINWHFEQIISLSDEEIVSLARCKPLKMRKLLPKTGEVEIFLNEKIKEENECIHACRWTLNLFLIESIDSYARSIQTQIEQPEKIGTIHSFEQLT